MELEYSDWNALRTAYGTRVQTSPFVRESSDFGGTWTTGGISLAVGPFSSASWSGGSASAMPLTSTENATGNAHLWRWAKVGPPLDLLATGIGPQLGGTGSATYLGQYYTFHESSPSEDNAIKNPRVEFRTPGGSITWAQSGLYASRQGIVGTVDSKSGRLIRVWRGKNDEILLAQSGSGTPESPLTPVALTGDTNAAAFTPSVACSDDPAVVANCIIVWASQPKETPGDHYHVIKWTQFRLVSSGGTFTFEFVNPVYAVGYVVFGRPNVTFTGERGGSKAFVIAWQVPTTCFFTLYKSASPISSFTGETGHCVASGVLGPPPLGTSNGYVEAWAPIVK